MVPFKKKKRIDLAQYTSTFGYASEIHLIALHWEIILNLQILIYLKYLIS